MIRQTSVRKPIILGSFQPGPDRNGLSGGHRVGFAMIVYVDLVFLTNLVVDGTVLLATAKARRLRPARWKLASAAALGAIYAAALFWAEVPYLYSLGAKLAVSALMVLVAFGYGGPLAFARTFGMFYAVNFVTLGGVLGLGSLVRAAGSPWDGMAITEQGGIALDWRMQLIMFGLAFALSVWLFHSTSESRRKQAETTALLWTATIGIDSQTWEVPALLDTGNRLYDPVTRTPVMIMEAAVWRQQLPAGWCGRLQTESADRLLAELDETAREAFPWMNRLRLVPYRGVNGKPRLMLAVKPDVVRLQREDRPPLSTDRVWIGLDGGALSAEGAYRVILHPELLQAGREDTA